MWKCQGSWLADCSLEAPLRPVCRMSTYSTCILTRSFSQGLRTAQQLPNPGPWGKESLPPPARMREADTEATLSPEGLSPSRTLCYLLRQRVPSGSIAPASSAANSLPTARTQGFWCHLSVTLLHTWCRFPSCGVKDSHSLGKSLLGLFREGSYQSLPGLLYQGMMQEESQVAWAQCPVGWTWLKSGQLSGPPARPTLRDNQVRRTAEPAPASLCALWDLSLSTVGSSHLSVYLP